METIAIYWEENIRTYGLQLEKNLCLVKADVLPPNGDALGQLLAEMGEDGTKPTLILAHPLETACLRISMLFPEKIKKHLIELQARQSDQKASTSFTIDAPVEMLYFHGPHFGDRYGIADLVARALKKKDIRYLAMVCSAASVHLIFAENIGDRAQKALGSVFNSP